MIGRLTRFALVLLVCSATGGCSRQGERQVVTRAARALQARDSDALRALAAPGGEEGLMSILASVPPDYVAYGRGEPRLEFRRRSGDDASYFVPARGKGRCGVGVVVSVVTASDRVRVSGIELRPDFIVPPDSLRC
jgi:hypothetical protein